MENLYFSLRHIDRTTERHFCYFQVIHYKLNPFIFIKMYSGKKNSDPERPGAIYLTICKFAVPLTLTVLLLLTGCRNRPATIKENQADPVTIRTTTLQSEVKTGLSENRADKQHESPEATINIGLMVSSQVSKSELARAASHGAELAVNQANEAGGYNNSRFRLLVRSCDGPWGVAAKQAVSLITEYDIKALLTSLDGRNAHLIEQVATKTKVLMLSARSADPTLSQAFVPWYYRCVPDDNQQAEALADELFKNRRLNNLTVVSENSYDGRLASGIFLKKLEEMHAEIPERLFYDELKPDFNGLIEQIKKTGINNIVLFGGPGNVLGIIKLLAEQGREQNLYGPFSVMGEEKTLEEFWNYTDNMVLTSPGIWFTPGGKKFQEAYKKAWGYFPGPAAACSYDGMNMLLETIRQRGREQEEMVDYLGKIKYEGVTGIIQFDERGNRKGKPGLMKIKDGFPVYLGRPDQVFK